MNMFIIMRYVSGNNDITHQVNGGSVNVMVINVFVLHLH